MTNLALLPAGLRDLLPDEAQALAASVETLMSVFSGHGYQRVAAPLLEFEDSLLSGSGAAVAEQMFRIMDPDSHRMMGLRADITPQIARIATTRLAHAPRPLRLSYAGECVRVSGTQIDPDRQVSQVGIELIGADLAAADAEIILAGAEALARLGLERVSFDLTLPTLAGALLDDAGFGGDARAALLRALDRKDTASVARLGGAVGERLNRLLLAAGPAPAAIAALVEAGLPASCQALAQRLAEIVALVHEAAPALRLTADPLDSRGFRYHTGVALTVFAPGRHEELGRGGRYSCGDCEPATGLTLYADALLRAAPALVPPRRLFVPAGVPRAAAAAWRDRGYGVLAGLVPVADDRAEARRLGCGYWIADGELAEVALG